MELLDKQCSTYEALEFWGLHECELDQKFIHDFHGFLFDTGIPSDMDSKGGKSFVYYGKDYKFVVSAFRQVYGISKSELSKLQYDEFKDLYEGLNHCENVVSKVMSYRTFKAPKRNKENADYIRNMNSLKARYK